MPDSRPHGQVRTLQSILPPAATLLLLTPAPSYSLLIHLAQTPAQSSPRTFSEQRSEPPFHRAADRSSDLNQAEEPVPPLNTSKIVQAPPCHWGDSRDHWHPAPDLQLPAGCALLQFPQYR